QAGRAAAETGGLERAEDAPARVDRDALADEAAVQQPVVRRLDARLADRLPGDVAVVALLLELARPDLAEEAEELRAERALGVAPPRERGHRQAGERRTALLEVEGERPRETLDDDRGRERILRQAPVD